jgi:hypothetical protein
MSVQAPVAMPVPVPVPVPAMTYVSTDLLAAI